ncbi:hypothetical protein ABFS82_08G221900 [Erythranthe guttata]|uniref:cyclin-D4-2-like n=1 Tax=Erythranthe guttata TaxID=4155 RepID=UPI00064DFFBD|nr:PREDICTED: cyclin-D4-2-like [Erythranthe guttata]|eukprot:XP_012845364.1 PREDICTED: cyclin-D4-2-like [Erythranthe guttata]
MGDDCSSFDCAETTTDLLCNEETKGFCFFDEDEGNSDVLVEKGVIFNNGGGSPSDSKTASFRLPLLGEECIRWMVEREREHLPRDDYVSRFRCGQLDFSLRRQALDWMFKACGHYNFGEMCLYSAMNYLDRFLSVYELPVCSLKRGNEIWAIQLVAVACLSIAAKIEEVNVPSTVDLQVGRPKFLFEGKTIQRMEMLVLSRLSWKIKAYTPFNFIDYYLTKMNNGEFPSRDSIDRSLRIILSTIEGIEFLEFRPSEIAAAVAVHVVSGETQQEIGILDSFVGIDKGRVVKCYELIKEMGSKNITTSNYLNSRIEPDSPNGVLEAGVCLSCNNKSDEIRTVESCPTSSSSHTTPNNKRRKISDS